MSTLLERFDKTGAINSSDLRRALAIAQAVDEARDGFGDEVAWIERRADELLGGR